MAALEAKDESYEGLADSLDGQVTEIVNFSNFTGEVLMNRKNKMGGVRIERQQYRRGGRLVGMEVPHPSPSCKPAGRRRGS